MGHRCDESDDAAAGDADLSHPIKNVRLVDVYTTSSGHIYAGLVVATPCPGDEYSQTRMLKKLEGYIRTIRFDANAAFGGASPDKCVITVAIHPESDERMFRLLDKCSAWLSDNGIALTVKRSLE